MKIPFLDKIIDQRLNNVVNEKTIIKQGKMVTVKRKTLERISKDIGKWRTAQEAAEDLEYPDRIELMQIYKDVMDDSQVYSSIQLRTNKATNGIFSIYENGEYNEELSLKFVDQKGYPCPGS